MATLAGLGELEIDQETLFALAREMGAPQTAAVERIVARDRPPSMPTVAEMEARLVQEQESAVKPTSNYVLFRDDIIDILRKYGLAGAAPAGAAIGMEERP